MPIISRLIVSATPLLNLVCACIIGASSAASASPTQPEAPLPQGVEQDWWGGVQKDIAASEYHVTLQKDGLQAPNRDHDLRTWFDKSGAISVSRTADSLETAPWQWGLKLDRYGWKDGAMQKAQPAEPQPENNIVTYQRGDTLREWYVNDPDGVRSWFEVKEQPAGSGATMRLELGVRGNTAPAMADSGDGIKFTTRDGVHVINYGGLKAWDANGAQLTCSLGLDGQQVVLDIEAASAVFPVTIDPLATTPPWIVESNQPNAYFGRSVASAGDVNGDGYSDVIVGANAYDNGETDEGRAFVYLGSPSGLASTAAWTAEGNQASAGFGISVACAGDVNGDGYSDVIVGAPYHDNGETDEGRAYVYLGSASGLSTIHAWTAEGNQTSALFGYSATSAGDVNADGYSDVIVGAYKYDNDQTDEGRAFVYMGSASGVALTAAWTAESNQATAWFGYSVASAGDVNGDGYSDVIVGAQFYDNIESTEGRAYVYMGSATGLASTAAWTAESNENHAYFGNSVASAGDVNDDGYDDVIVGADMADTGQFEEGRAYVYMGSATGLALTPAWTAESNQANAYFGISVASAGDVNGDGYSDVIVGASHFDNGQVDKGRAYIYLGSHKGLSTSPAWTAESNQEGATFGISVASAGDINGDGYSDVIVGAHGYNNGEVYEGRAYVYLGSTSGLNIAAAWTAESNQPDANFGASVASAGDVNSDGYSDVIVGAYKFDNGQTDEGRVFVYLGSESGLATTFAWSAEGNATIWFGTSVASAGDVNGDGYSDVIVGAIGGGAAYVYHGSSSGLSSSASWTTSSVEISSLFGYSVASAGDVNGDGYSDVIVGAPDYSQGQAREGRAYLYLGSATGLSTISAWSAESNSASVKFGTTVASAGDVNGDGYSDVIVGAPYYGNVNGSTGRAFVYMGTALGLTSAAPWIVDGGVNSHNFGYSVASAGDVNGDGYSDVVVGAPYYSNGQTNEGRAYVYQGSATGLAATAAWAPESDQEQPNFGHSVASAGDVNGDGYSDVIVGAFTLSNGENSEGGAYLYLGSTTGLAPTAAWTAEGNQETSLFGVSVASAGDVNGDGYSDVIVGAPYFDNGELQEGRVYVYMGYASGLSANIDIVINEFMTDPEGDDNVDRSEWIELYNKKNTPIDLSGYKIQANNNTTPTINTLPAGTIIGPKDFLVLAAHKVSFARGQYQRIDENKVVDLGWPYTPVLGNGTGFISLTRPSEQKPFQKINYSGQTPWPGVINSAQTLELKSPDLNPELGSNWALSSAGSGGSPLRPNAPQNISNITITGGRRNIQYPATTSTVTVSAAVTANPAPASVNLMVDTGQGYFAIPMINTGGTTYTANIPPVASGTLVKHYVKVTAANGYYKTQPYTQPDAFFVDNNFAGAADLAITEIMSNPTGNDNLDNSEWIEIYNRRPTPVNLSFFVWGPTVYNIGNRIMPEGTVIPGNGYLVLAGQKGLFTSQYPAVSANLVIDAQWASGSKLPNDADGTTPVPLVHANAVDWNNTRVAFDVVPYGDGGSWPFNADGRSIQLIMTHFHENENGSYWNSSALGGETPAATNTQSKINDWSVY